MNLEPPIRKNIAFAYYEAVHKKNIDKKAREKLHKDVDDFITAKNLRLQKGRGSVTSYRTATVRESVPFDCATSATECPSPAPGWS